MAAPGPDQLPAGQRIRPAPRRPGVHYEHMFVYGLPMDAHVSQRATLGLLLEMHPRTISVEQLREQLAGIDVDEALAALQSDGLANRLGDLVGASRAAVRADELAL